VPLHVASDGIGPAFLARTVASTPGRRALSSRSRASSMLSRSETEQAVLCLSPSLLAR
jgi:hypothetical protein